MKFIYLLLVACIIMLACEQQDDTSNLSSNNNITDSTLTPLSVIEEAFLNNQSNIQVKQVGTIISILSDDTVGDCHQRIIVQLLNMQTLLIAHNIDIALRIPNPVKGKKLKFHGEYEWNSKGGVIHWTHKDPNGIHINGWLEYEGLIYD